MRGTRPAQFDLGTSIERGSRLDCLAECLRTLYYGDDRTPWSSLGDHDESRLGWLLTAQRMDYLMRGRGLRIRPVVQSRKKAL